VNLLIVIHQFLPRHAAGSEYYTYYLAKELQRLGHRVHLFFTEVDLDRPHAELRTRELDGLPCFEAVNNHRFPTFRHTYKDEAMEANLRVVLDRVKPDIVHIQHLHLHSIGYLDLLKQRGLKVVFTLHEFITMCHRNGQLLRENLVLCEGPEPAECARCARMWPMPAPMLGIGKTEEELRFQAVEKRRREVQAGLDQVDLFISPSRFLRAKYIEYGLVTPERILFSDNGMAAAQFRTVPRVPSDAIRFGYFGTISDWKGIHLIVEAFNGLPEAGLEGKIYGDLTFLPDYSRRLRNERRNLALRFLGRFPNAQIAEVLAEIDVLIVPSVWFENSPLTIHEAFIAGVPVVCSDRGGRAELVADGKNGLHFRLGDAVDLRRKLQRFLDEPGLLADLRGDFPAVKDIASDARDMVERYNALIAGQTVTA
jgi:glycosyltransferase involved in cell wall biosynthesis